MLSQIQLNPPQITLESIKTKFYYSSKTVEKGNVAWETRSPSENGQNTGQKDRTVFYKDEQLFSQIFCTHGKSVCIFAMFNTEWLKKKKS